MRLRNKVFAGLALGCVLASGTAAAALKANELHLALTSLRLALVKIGVANAVLSSPTPPANNAAAHVAAPNQLTSAEIRAIVVSAGGVINVYLAPAVGITGGIVQLVPAVVTGKDGKKGVTYTCFSPNIPDIARAAPECTYHAPGK